MEQGKEQSKTEKAATALKEVQQKKADHPDLEYNPDADQPDSKEVAEQLKGSDADVDANVGKDQSVTSGEKGEQAKGSDADHDQKK